MPTRVAYLHGMGGSPEDWRSVQTRAPGLALALDAGASDPAECAATFADQALKQLSGSIALCGYSMGGRIAVLAAEILLGRKKKPDALILVSTGFGGGTAEERAERARRDEEWAQLAEKNAEEFWKRWYEQDLFASFQALPEATRKGWLDQRKSLDIAALTGQLRRLGPARHDDLFPVLKSVCAKGVKVLYIAGELDKKYSELSRKVAEIPGVTVDKIAGAGHILPLEAPEPLALRIARFVR
jgi:2-succinyl-6-hydroxy-2,4-cyclohexadiene-1-carboxylate synthase